MSHKAMSAHGWTRYDPRPWKSKLSARWRHVSGWHLQHCGHPTALRPWALYAPDGAPIYTGVVDGYAADHGAAWNDLRSVAEWLELYLADPWDLTDHRHPWTQCAERCDCPRNRRPR